MATYARDPRWIVAKYAGKDKFGTEFRRGERIYYYPIGKVILAGAAAEQAAREFETAVQDENFYA